MNEQGEPMLVYQPEIGQWRGANAQFSIWMDDATFHAYVAAWYNWLQWLADRPPAERRTAAVAHCQRVRYWVGCERNYDRRVHIIYH
jgi:hypothetical protein